MLSSQVVFNVRLISQILLDETNQPLIRKNKVRRVKKVVDYYRLVTFQKAMDALMSIRVGVFMDKNQPLATEFRIFLLQLVAQSLQGFINI
jgi:hypothetical protein